MSNDYFAFKQFRIAQDQCAMKVSTDACIQGAWTPVSNALTSVLDIGTGTGLLALMLAQRAPNACIDAVEIDPGAAVQAAANCGASPWASRIRVTESDIQNFSPGKHYELIISNPPFFKNSLLGTGLERNQARHQLSLGFDALLVSFDRLLSARGVASLLLPAAEHRLWSGLLYSSGWEIFHELHIVPAVGKPANRIVSLCRRRSGTAALPFAEELLIRDRSGAFTPEFTSLLRPFYLKL